MGFGMERLNAGSNSEIWQFPVAMLISLTAQLTNHELILNVNYGKYYVIRLTYRPAKSSVLIIFTQCLLVLVYCAC